MKLLALSGSLRHFSTNTALLRAIQNRTPTNTSITIWKSFKDFPIFSPDGEGAQTPLIIREFVQQVEMADGLIVSCPEYAHGIPGGFKNALDWLVSNEKFPGKSVMIAHASHRGEFVLSALHEVLKTMSANIIEDAFLRIPLMSKTQTEIDEIANLPQISSTIEAKLSIFISAISKQGNRLP